MNIFKKKIKKKKSRKYTLMKSKYSTEQSVCQEWLRSTHIHRVNIFSKENPRA